MRVFKTKWFARFARRERISDASLGEAVRRAEAWLEADAKSLARALEQGLIEEVDDGEEQ